MKLTVVSTKGMSGPQGLATIPTSLSDTNMLAFNAHLGNPCRERRSHFAVYFTIGFNNKTV